MYSITAIKRQKGKDDFQINYFDFYLHEGVVEGAIFASPQQEALHLFGFLEQVSELSKSPVLLYETHRNNRLKQGYLASRKQNNKKEMVRQHSLYMEANKKYIKESDRVSKLTEDLTTELKKLPYNTIKAIYPYISATSDAESLKYSLFLHLREKG